MWGFDRFNLGEVQYWFALLDARVAKEVRIDHCYTVLKGEALHLVQTTSAAKVDVELRSIC